MKRTGLALAACVLLQAAAARARTPEIAIDPRDGIWIAQDDKFIFQTLDRWSVFSAGATVNKLVVDQTHPVGRDRRRRDPLRHRQPEVDQADHGRRAAEPAGQHRGLRRPVRVVRHQQGPGPLPQDRSHAQDLRREQRPAEQGGHLRGDHRPPGLVRHARRHRGLQPRRRRPARLRRGRRPGLGRRGRGVPVRRRPVVPHRRRPVALPHPAARVQQLPHVAHGRAADPRDGHRRREPVARHRQRTVAVRGRERRDPHLSPAGRPGQQDDRRGRADVLVHLLHHRQGDPPVQQAHARHSPFHRGRGTASAGGLDRLAVHGEVRDRDVRGRGR